MGAGLVHVLGMRGVAVVNRETALAAGFTGMAGSTSGWIIEGLDASVIVKAVIVAIACTFGLLAWADKAVAMRRERSVTRLILMNAGAVYTMALITAWLVPGPLPVAAGLGLGVGLLGTKALQLGEDAATKALNRIFGDPVVTRAELDERLGDVANRVQGAISEQALKGKPEATGKGGNDGD